jgi:S-adenosylmethionine hydrolase
MSQTSIIALLTDFGTDDHYVGVMKGVILKVNPRVMLIDISHGIRAQDILQGAFTLRNSYRYFPPRTVFLVVVDPGVGSHRKAIIARTRRYTFVAPDNGILSPALAQEPSADVYSIEKDRYFLKPVSGTFHGRDIFAPVAAHLSKGLPPVRFGRRQRSYIKLRLPCAQVDNKTKTIRGQVVGVDHFGNLVTNIESFHFKMFKGQFAVKIKNTPIGGLTDAYAAVPKGRWLAIIGSSGCLEISVNQGSAARKLKAGIGDPVKITGKY